MTRLIVLDPFAEIPTDDTDDYPEATTRNGKEVPVSALFLTRYFRRDGIEKCSIRFKSLNKGHILNAGIYNLAKEDMLAMAYAIIRELESNEL